MDGIVPVQPVTIKQSPSAWSDFLPRRSEEGGDNAGKTEKGKKSKGE